MGKLGLLAEMIRLRGYQGCGGSDTENQRGYDDRGGGDEYGIPDGVLCFAVIIRRVEHDYDFLILFHIVNKRPGGTFTEVDDRAVGASVLG